MTTSCILDYSESSYHKVESNHNMYSSYEYLCIYGVCMYEYVNKDNLTCNYEQNYILYLKGDGNRLQ